MPDSEAAIKSMSMEAANKPRDVYVDGIPDYIFKTKENRSILKPVRWKSLAKGRK